MNIAVAMMVGGFIMAATLSWLRHEPDYPYTPARSYSPALVRAIVEFTRYPPGHKDDQSMPELYRCALECVDKNKLPTGVLWEPKYHCFCE
jgi:hypothetical protein